MDATARKHNRVCPLAIAALIAFGLALSPSAAHGRVFKGRLELRHSDDFKRDKATSTYLLRTRQGRYLKLDLRGGTAHALARSSSAKRPRLVPGARIEVRGSLRGNRLVASLGQVRSSRNAPAKTASVSGPRKTAVIMFNFQNDTQRPWTAAQARGAVFTDPNSVNAYYREQSSGAISLTGKVRADGDVFGWYTIPKNNSTCEWSDVTGWRTAADAAAAAAGVDLSGYDNYIYWFSPSSCPWAGLAYLPGNAAWINGSVGVGVITHELGHNFGAHHASSYNCTAGGIRVSISGSCTLDEYGDPFDVMGAAGRHQNALHKIQTGALPQSAGQTVTTGGTYTLAPSEQLVPGKAQVLRIPRTRMPDGTVSDYYYLDFRQPFGTYFDNFTSTDPVVKGVGIRIASDWGTAVQTKLLDTTPGTATFADAPLLVGNTFTDAATQISVTTLMATTTGASVRITTPAPDTSPPTAPSDLAGVAQTNTRVNLSWLPSSDNVAVAGYRVYRGGAQIGTQTNTALTDTAASPNTTNNYSVVAYDAAGNVSPANQVNVSTVVQCADADGNGVVLVSDILVAVHNYGKTSGQSGWNPLADFNGDSRGDTFDILMAVTQYGSHCTR